MDTQYPAHPRSGDVITDALDNVGRAVMVGSLIGTITGAAVGGAIGGAGPAFSVVLLPEAAVTCLGGALIGASIGALAGTIAIGGGALVGASAKIVYTTTAQHRKP
ncbi:hypothetical protein [Nocardia donostiensis]|uniref:Uncharacterized protein n=1 Tax=Nocardia donostiensis TaxID=1538463 RepID=A0A1W0B8L6_9NOCA|nr:hypothetical protein [Nocardia donostiensis]ONM50484.1 hypothetical protein B0T46_00740 [Nocardia donostiensis]OQS17279.1 hypothetical protein B0T36_01410 [Nocardia donostiensis]OQS18860.1 hypothetical protein B0T44_17260 [Nocardia donostiensis]